MRLNCQAKNQIVIPREARNALGLKAAAKLLIVVRHNTVVLLRKPKMKTKDLKKTKLKRTGEGRKI